MGITGEQYGAILTPMILLRLPQDIRFEWSRDGEGHESDLDFLLKFLSKEIQRRERSHVFKDSKNPSHTPHEEKHIKNHRISTASALQSTLSSKPFCGVCRKTYPTDRCFRLLQERRNKLSAARFCFRCLLSGHIARGCSASCSNCRGCHHVLLCNPQVPDKNETVPKSVTPSVHSKIPVICTPLYRKIPSSFLESFGDVQFTDDYTLGKEVKVDILIGLDAYWKFVKLQMVNVNSEGFGWIFSGVVPTSDFVGGGGGCLPSIVEYFCNFILGLRICRYFPFGGRY